MDKEQIEILFQKKVKSLKDEKNKPWSYSGFKSVLENEWCINTYIPQKFSVEQNII